MLVRLIAAAVLLAALGAVWLRRPAAEEPARGPQVRVVDVVDGDTIELVGEKLVRLVQIDAPELGDRECFARRSAAILAELLPRGTAVRVETDESLSFLGGRSRLDADKVDRYGRQLGYVFRGGDNVNVELVTRGAASVWFYDRRRGRYAGELLEAAREAREKRRGLWGACPATALDPYRSVESRRT